MGKLFESLVLRDKQRKAVSYRATIVMVGLLLIGVATWINRDNISQADQELDAFTRGVAAQYKHAMVGTLQFQAVVDELNATMATRDSLHMAKASAANDKLLFALNNLLKAVPNSVTVAELIRDYNIFYQASLDETITTMPFGDSVWSNRSLPTNDQPAQINQISVHRMEEAFEANQQAFGVELKYRLRGIGNDLKENNQWTTAAIMLLLIGLGVNQLVSRRQELKRRQLSVPISDLLEASLSERAQQPASQPVITPIPVPLTAIARTKLAQMNLVKQSQTGPEEKSKTRTA